jgi:beta-N-acetylhexosaminidase
MVSLESMVGSRLMFGLPGPDLTDDDVRLFRETQAAGIMLYRRNFETPARLAKLLTGLEEAAGRRTWLPITKAGGSSCWDAPSPSSPTTSPRARRARSTSCIARASSRGASCAGSEWT